MAQALNDPAFKAEMKAAGTIIPFWVNNASATQKLAAIKTATQDADYKAAIAGVRRSR